MGSPRRAGVLGLLAALAALLLPLVPLDVAAAAGGPASLSSSRPGAARDVVARQVRFSLVDTSDSIALSCGDGHNHRVLARLVGPRRAVEGTDPTVRVNVLVHDAGTGGWFWDPRGEGGRSYARALARRGETSLVLSRLGYDRSRLRDGDASCLTAQANMLHQVVQHLYSGQYRPVGGGGSLPNATQVVLHGHGTGATLAQLESAEHDDVAGLVLMSVPAGGSTGLAREILAGQSRACLGAPSYAPFGTAAQFRRSLFAAAPRGVRRLATRLRNPTPCGDVASTTSAVAASGGAAGRIDQPVLVLSAARDRRGTVLTRGDVTRRFGSSRDARGVVLARTGSAVPLERTAQASRLASRYLERLPRGEVG